MNASVSECSLCHVTSNSLTHLSGGVDDPMVICNSCLNPNEEEYDEEEVDKEEDIKQKMKDARQYHNSKCDFCYQFCDPVYGMGCPTNWPGGGDVLVTCAKCWKESAARRTL